MECVSPEENGSLAYGSLSTLCGIVQNVLYPEIQKLETMENVNMEWQNHFPSGNVCGEKTFVRENWTLFLLLRKHVTQTLSLETLFIFCGKCFLRIYPLSLFGCRDTGAGVSIYPMGFFSPVWKVLAFTPARGWESILFPILTTGLYHKSSFLRKHQIE